MEYVYLELVPKRQPNHVWWDQLVWPLSWRQVRPFLRLWIFLSGNKNNSSLLESIGRVWFMKVIFFNVVIHLIITINKRKVPPSGRQYWIELLNPQVYGVGCIGELHLQHNHNVVQQVECNVVPEEWNCTQTWYIILIHCKKNWISHQRGKNKHWHRLNKYVKFYFNYCLFWISKNKFIKTTKSLSTDHASPEDYQIKSHRIIYYSLFCIEGC